MNRSRWLQTCALSFSPIFGSISPITVLEQFATVNRVPIWNTIGIVILTKAGIAREFALADDQNVRRPYGAHAGVSVSQACSKASDFH